MSRRPKPPIAWKELFRQHMTRGYLIGFLLIVAIIFIAGGLFWSTFL